MRLSIGALVVLMRDNNLMHDIREIMLKYGHSSKAIDLTAHGQLLSRCTPNPAVQMPCSEQVSERVNK